MMFVTASEQAGAADRASANLGPAGGAAGVKEQGYILLLGCVNQLSRPLLHLESFAFGLHFHCRGQQLSIKQTQM